MPFIIPMLVFLGGVYVANRNKPAGTSPIYRNVNTSLDIIKKVNDRFMAVPLGGYSVDSQRAAQTQQNFNYMDQLMNFVKKNWVLIAVAVYLLKGKKLF